MSPDRDKVLGCEVKMFVEPYMYGILGQHSNIQNYPKCSHRSYLITAEGVMSALRLSQKIVSLRL